MLIDPDSRSVEVFRYNERDRFELHDQTGTDTLDLRGVDARIPMTEVFNGLTS